MTNYMSHTAIIEATETVVAQSSPAFYVDSRGRVRRIHTANADVLRSFYCTNEPKTYVVKGFRR